MTQVRSAMTGFVLEVCVASVEDAISAKAGGADRLELNMGFELSGLTPTLGLLREVKLTVDLPVIALIRPRAAGFHYSPSERRVMLRDIELLLEWGADGVAVGSLQRDGTIDVEFVSEVRKLMSGSGLVFHRAFDLTANPELALQQLIDIGATRVLTSGGAPSAVQGISQIARLQRLAANDIEILPAGGIAPDNVSKLIHATGCQQVHGSFRTLKNDPAGTLSNSSYPCTCQSLVARTRAVLDQIA